MASALKFSTFDIRNFIDRLTPAKGKNRYHCPVCGSDNLTFDSEDYQGYTCWNDESFQHQAEIREAISPLSEVLEQQPKGTIQTFPRKLQKQTLAPAPLPEKIVLAKLAAPATDLPQPQERNDRKRGKVLVTTYQYSDTQWVERVQYDNPEKPKGYSKDFFPWHLGEDGKPVCKKGEADWLPYRFEEAIAAIKASSATVVLVDEGEGCVEARRSIKLAALTMPGSQWSEADLRQLALLLKPSGVAIAFSRDNDTTGEEKAGRLLKACNQVGVPCLLLNPLNLYPDLPESGDVVDCLKAMSVSEYIERLEAEIQAAAEERRQTESRHQQAQEEKKQRGQTPAEIAAEIAEDYRDRLAWNDEAGFWYRYEAESSGVWAMESDTAIGAVVIVEFENRMGLTYKANWIEQCVKILKWKLIVKQWEKPSCLLPFRNGVLNTQSGEFLDHAPGYRFTWSLPRDHNPLATEWKTINTWMDEATGGSTKIKNILLCWLNACIKGRSDLQRFLHLTGAGGTGKGTFIRLAISLVGGKNNHASSLVDWCGNRFEPVNAYKKRLLTFADEDKYTGGLGNFKKVTGGDAIRGEIKKKQAFDFIFEGMVMLASNYPIFSGDTSSGIYRRLLMIPFNVIIPPHKRRNLDGTFEPELAALTNYVLSIPDEVVSETLRQSVDQAPEVIERAWDWRMRQDSVASWLNECVIRDLQASERVGNDKDAPETLFGSYYHYCDKTGARAKGSREFSPALLELINNDPALNWGVQKKRVAGGFMIQGLRLRRIEDMDQPYCIEALADVGSEPSVGRDVGCNVQSEPLLEKSYVGCVGSTKFIKENSISEFGRESSELNSENYNKKDSSPYTPYTTETGQAFETLHAQPTVQDSAPYTGVRKPNLFNSEQLSQALQMMIAIDSAQSFKPFYDFYQRRSEAERHQLLDAFHRVDEDALVRFYDCWQQFDSPEFEAIPKPAQISTSEIVKPVGQNKWVYARLSQDSGETLVKVLSEQFNSITVYISGLGRKQIKHSDVVRLSDYTS